MDSHCLIPGNGDGDGGGHGGGGGSGGDMVLEVDVCLKETLSTANACGNVRVHLGSKNNYAGEEMT